MATPRAMPGPVMPGVRRTPGRLRGGDARGVPDPPCAGYLTPYTTCTNIVRLNCLTRALLAPKLEDGHRREAAQHAGGLVN